MIKKPQKAPSEPIANEDLVKLFLHGPPVVGSRKLDGYRCTTHGNCAYTSSMKPVTNKFIQEILSQPEYTGLDGELIVGKPNDLNAFNNTTGPVRKASGEPDFKFYVFDFLNLSLPYEDRLKHLEAYKDLPHIVVLQQKKLFTPDEVLIYESECVEKGFEGAMIRTLFGKYKQGRCTLKELNIFKRKPTVDDEAMVIGFEEQQENLNEPYKNELGNMVRSAHKANKVGKNTLGKLILSSSTWKEPFACGTGIGMTDELRQLIWDNRKSWLNTVWVYKYQKHGSINGPRQPILKGPRDLKDLTTY